MVWEKAPVGGTPPSYFGARESKGKGHCPEKSSVGRYTGVQHHSAGPAQSRQKYPKRSQMSRVLIFVDNTRVSRNPFPLIFGPYKPKK